MFSRRNLVTYAIALLLVLAFNFLLPRMMPGDPLMAIYGEEALVQMTPELKANLVERFALDQPMWQQFGAYFGALFRGDLGYSYYYNAPAFEVILGRLPWTLLLVGLSLVLSTLLGIVLGIESGWRRGSKTDRSMLAGLMALNGFPDFFIGMVLLLVFGVTLGIFPLAGALTPYSGLSGGALLLDVLKHLALPLAALTLAHIAGAYLLTRNTMITVVKEPYMLTARAKGLSQRVMKYRHAGRNSMLPVITRTGLWLGRVVTGALFVEIVFSYPGLGYLAYEALLARDYPIIEGVLLVVALFVLVANFLADLSYPKLDPRVSYAR
ncbi:MAG: ABC transporter permease [Chloroflexi bacterium]|nr:MAG: ABC transporter permease [Chloroflexota bacterium]RLC96108.1 MAG: ABC transporter permease [Chloroflexota bacterium]